MKSSKNLEKNASDNGKGVRIIGAFNGRVMVCLIHLFLSRSVKTDLREVFQKIDKGTLLS